MNTLDYEIYSLIEGRTNVKANSLTHAKSQATKLGLGKRCPLWIRSLESGKLLSRRDTNGEWTK